MTDQDIEIINYYLAKVHEKVNIPFSPITLYDTPDGIHINASRFVKLDKVLTEEECIQIYQKFDFELSEFFDIPDTIFSDTEEEGVYHYQYSFKFNKYILRDIKLKNLKDI